MRVVVAHILLWLVILLMLAWCFGVDEDLKRWRANRKRFRRAVTGYQPKMPKDYERQRETFRRVTSALEGIRRDRERQNDNVS